MQACLDQLWLLCNKDGFMLKEVRRWLKVTFIKAFVFQREEDVRSGTSGSKEQNLHI